MRVGLPANGGAEPSALYHASPMSPLPDVLCAGAMLGGLLALTGSWSRGARAGRFPHLAVGAVASVGTAAFSRFPGRPVAAVALAIAAGAGSAFLLEAAQRRLDPVRFPFAADAAGLAGVLGLVALLQPMPMGLAGRSLLGGGWPGQPGDAAVALAVAGAGVAGGLALALVPAARLALPARWLVAGALTAGLGAVIAWTTAVTQIPARPEPLALALAAAVAAMLGRGPVGAVAAGAVTGMAFGVASAAGIPGAAAAGALALVLVAVRPPAADPDPAGVRQEMPVTPAAPGLP